MRQSVRSGLLTSLVVASAAVAGAQDPKTKPAARPAAPATKPAAPATKPATPPGRPAILDQVLATVNGEPITREVLLRFMANFVIPPGEATNEQIYQKGIEGLSNYLLVNQYLVKQNPTVTEKDLDAEYNAFAEVLKKDGQDINVALAEAGMTPAKVREDMKKKLRWDAYIKNVATDAELKKYVDQNKDVFNRTQVRASHIVLRADADAPVADKAKVKARLIEIKKEIDSGKISFADAANKYSEDPGNKESPSGGDLGFFTRRGMFDPVFTAAAFSFKKGTVSDPVETPYGYHLVQVTDRKEGTAPNFEVQKPQILAEYTTDLQERIVAEMRKTAKIVVQPMPADLFPKPPVPSQGPAPDSAAPAPKAAAPAPKAAAPR